MYLAQVFVLSKFVLQGITNVSRAFIWSGQNFCKKLGYILHAISCVMIKFIEGLVLEMFLLGTGLQWVTMFRLFSLSKIISGLNGLHMFILKILIGGIIVLIKEQAGIGEKSIQKSS